MPPLLKQKQTKKNDEIRSVTPRSCRPFQKLYFRMDANKTAGEETRWQLHKNAACNPEQVLEATPHKTLTVRPPAPYHENYPS